MYMLEILYLFCNSQKLFRFIKKLYIWLPKSAGMTTEEIIKICSGDLSVNFASRLAGEILSAPHGMEKLWYVHKNYREMQLPRAVKDKIAFRSSYILERIYFGNREAFRPYLKEFFLLFPGVENGSSRRHYVKMGESIIASGLYIPDNPYEICVACLDWITDKKSRPAIVIWAVDILFLLRNRVPEIGEILPDIVEQLRQNPLPSIQCRVKRWLK